MYCKFSVLDTQNYPPQLVVTFLAGKMSEIAKLITKFKQSFSHR